MNDPYHRRHRAPNGDALSRNPCPYCCLGLTPGDLPEHTRAACESVLLEWARHDPEGASVGLEALQAVRWMEVLA